jgi:hypothetical protein
MKVWFLLTVLIMAIASLTAQTAIAPAGGNGSTSDPYQIATLENLFWIAADDSIVSRPAQAIRWSNHYIQTADIDASSTIDWFDGQGWSPIGAFYGWQNPDNRPFSGSYNGQNHTINALYINRQIWGVGFIGLSDNATITQLGLTNVNSIGNLDVGAIVGYQVNSTVSNCYSTGDLSGNQYIGGLIGYQRNSTISNCYSAVTVYGNQFVAGFIGYQYLSIINNCFSTGSVDGNDQVGGLVGYQRGSSIDLCYSSANVEGNQYVGGLVGYHSYSSINNSYKTGAVGGNNIIGGLVGHQYISTINNSYSASQVNAINYAGGLVAGLYDSSSTSCYWDIGISGQTTSYGGEGRTTPQMTYPYDTNTYVGWDFSNIWAYDTDHTINNGYPYLRQMPVSIAEETDSGSSVSYVPTIRNYPNPFNPQTTICFSLPENTNMVDLMIYNLRGQLIRTLISDAVYPKGESSIIWNGRDDHGRAVSSGRYFYRLVTPYSSKTGQMTMMK